MDASESARLDQLTVMLNSGDVEGALGILRAGPWTTSAAHRLIVAHLFAASEYAEAETVATDGLASFPADVALHVGHARSLVALGKQPRSAIASFEKALELDPNLDSIPAADERATIFVEWGNALIDARRFADALAKYELAEKHHPPIRPVTLHNIATVHISVEEWYEAMTGYDQARRIEADDVTLVGLATAQWKCGLLDEAEKTLSEVTKAAGPLALPYLRMRMYWSAGRYADARREALALYEGWKAEALKKPEVLSSLNEAPEFLAAMLVDGLNAAGEFLDALDANVPPVSEYETAERHLLRARILLAKAEREPDSSSRMKLRNEAYSRCRAAIYVMRRLLDEEKGRPAVETELLILGRACLMCEAYADAKKYLTEAGKLSPRSSATDAAIGLMHMQFRNHAAAIRAFEAAAARDATNLENRLLLVEALLRGGDFDRAESEIGAVLKLAPLNVDACIALGRLQIELAEKGDVDGFHEAVTQLTRALGIAGTIVSSKTLPPRERANVYYLRGFSRTRMYDEQKTVKDPSLLLAARDDFAKCVAQDPDNHRALAALRKIDARLEPRIGEWISDHVAGPACGALSLGVYATAAYRFADGLLSPGYASILLFGSLLFLIASFSLPQLLKLKVGSVELEKAAPDTSVLKVPLQISKAPNYR